MLLILMSCAECFIFMLSFESDIFCSYQSSIISQKCLTIICQKLVCKLYQNKYRHCNCKPSFFVYECSQALHGILQSEDPSPQSLFINNEIMMYIRCPTIWKEKSLFSTQPYFHIAFMCYSWYLQHLSQGLSQPTQAPQSLFINNVQSIVIILLSSQKDLCTLR